jgi:hypothetical protein
MTPSAGQLARRSLLQRILGAVGTTAILCVRPNAANAAIKISQKAVAYQDHPEGDKRCEKCAQFVAPSECKMVDGIQVGRAVRIRLPPARSLVRTGLVNGWAEIGAWASIDAFSIRTLI